MKVQGSVLHDLNHNFSSAWDRETFWIKKWFTDGLSEQRNAINPEHFKSAGPTMAQICRTQPQERRGNVDPGAVPQGVGQRA